MNDWRTCPACGKEHALVFSSGEVKGERVITCRFCQHRQVVAPPKPKTEKASV